jgi:hypothetical protein
MPHPFFDVPSYPWHRADAIAAYKVLYDAIRPPATIDTIYRECGPDPAPLALGKAPNEIWKDVLELLTVASRLRKLFENLLSRGAYAAIHGSLRAVLDAQDVLQEPLLTGDLLFIDRAPLRGELAKLAALNPAVRTLLVRGKADSGKSWSRHMVVDLAKVAGEECLYLYEGMVSTVEDVLDDLFTAVGDAGAVPPVLETEHAWFRKACLKLQESAKKRNQGVWIVADDLGSGAGGPRLDPRVRRFFDQFVLHMANPAFARWFRLVLIDYPDGAVPTKWIQGSWAEDRVDPAEINEGTIAQFLLDWARRKEKQLAPEKAKELAQDVLAKAAAPAPADADKSLLQRIHNAVGDALKGL